MSDIRKYITLIESSGKIVENASKSVMDKVVDAFAMDTQKYKTATEKLNAVKEVLINTSNGAEAEEIKSITSAQFFKYRKDRVTKPEPQASTQFTTVPEWLMNALVGRFNMMRGQFSSASDKLNAVKQELIRSNPTDRKNIEQITPKMFFDFKNGKRYMVPTIKRNTAPRKSDKPIKFDVSLSGGFIPLNNETFKSNTLNRVFEYYKNTYYNTMPMKELATNIKRAHLEFNEDYDVPTIEKELERTKVNDSLTKRLDDTTIIEKSIKHFGFSSDEDIKKALTSEFSFIKDDVDVAGIMKHNRNHDHDSLEYARYANKQLKRRAYMPHINEAENDIVKAYLARDAKKLDHYTKKLQCITFLYDTTLVKYSTK